MTTVTITGPMPVPHADPDAAGFADGYHWTVDDPDVPELAALESYAPTRDEAERQAREHADVRRLFDVVVRDA